MSKLDRLRTTAAPALTVALVEGGEIIADEQRSLVPVRTGRLKSSIRTEIGQKGARASDITVQVKAGGPGAWHAFLVEYGTIKMDAQPFFYRGWEHVKRRVRRGINAALRASMRKAIK